MRAFPASASASSEPDTLPDRAMRKARKQRLIPQPGPEDKGEETPRSKTVKRERPAPPTRPSPTMRSTVPSEPSAEAQRSSSISAALLKGAAMVPQSSISGTLRGLLGGASVGMDIDAALTTYRDRKRAETAQTAVQRESAPPVTPQTPLNVPPDVVGRALGGGRVEKAIKTPTRRPRVPAQKKAKTGGMNRWEGMSILD